MVDSGKILSEDEWLQIINAEAHSQDVNEEEKRKMAQTFSYHFMTINDAIQLNEQQLVTKFNIKSRDIVEQIFEWQRSFPATSLQTTNAVSSYKEEPLVGIYETMQSKITEDDVVDAIRQMRTVNHEQNMETRGTKLKIVFGFAARVVERPYGLRRT